MRLLSFNGSAWFALAGAASIAFSAACSDSRKSALETAPQDVQAKTPAVGASSAANESGLTPDTLILYQLGYGSFLVYERVANTAESAIPFTLANCTIQLALYNHADQAGTPVWQGSRPCAPHIVGDVPAEYVPSTNGDTTIYTPITGDGSLDGGKALSVNGQWTIPAGALRGGTYDAVGTINGLFSTPISTVVNTIAIASYQPGDPGPPARPTDTLVIH